MKIKRLLAILVALTFITVPAFAASVDVSGHLMTFGSSSSGGSTSVQVTLVFTGDENVTVEGGDSYTTSVRSGSKLTNLPDIEIADEYKFVGWKNKETDEIVDFSTKIFTRKTTFVPVYTTADSTGNSVIVFTIGSRNYTVDGVQYITDAAPYIDANSRTMLPVRAVANSLSISDENIKWDAATKTATISKADGTVVSITVGSNVIYVNGEAVTIDTTAVITQDRTFLPLRAVLNALGVADSQISWNDSLKQVTITL